MREKGEIARYEQFLLFPQCFQKLSVLMRQNEYLWGKGLRLSLADTLIGMIPIFGHLVSGFENENTLYG